MADTLQFICDCSRNRAWSPPPSSSLAEERTPLLDPPSVRRRAIFRRSQSGWSCSRNRALFDCSSQIGQGLDCHYAGPVPNPAPLSTLLSRVGAAFTADFERRLSDAGFPDMTFSLGTNVLRFLRPGGALRMGSLTEMSGVTKQAISQQVAYLEARGYVTVEPDAADSRAKLVRLTKKGQRSNEAARSLFAAVERDWRQRFGGDEMRHLRTLLEDILDSMNPSH
jgi:DNA-binding MarR family transcriptional regulator